MARYVIVEFDDDEQAEAFVAKINDREGRRFRVRWVFQKPRRFCECPKVREPRSARGEKYGWWVHDQCGRPRKGFYQTPRNLIGPQPTKPSEQPCGWMFATSMPDFVMGDYLVNR